MKIIQGEFPWRLLYAPLAVALVGWMLYATITDSWKEPIGPGLYLFSAGYVVWWAYLTIRAGVIPSPIFAIDRDSNPILFWSHVAFILALAVIFLLFSASMLGWLPAPG